MIQHLRANLILAAITLLICSVAYPVTLLLVGDLVFPGKAQGSLVKDSQKRVIGSVLIAQEFKGDEWFQSRPSAAAFNAMASSGSNLAASNPRLRDRVARQIGPIVSYRSGSSSAGSDKARPRTPQADMETWFTAKPDRVLSWAAGSTVAGPNWAKTDFSGDQYGLQGQYILQWVKDHPEVLSQWKRENPDQSEDPKPEDLVNPFFASFAKAHPGKFPIEVEVPKPDGTLTRKIIPGLANATVHANFFDLWAADPENSARVRDLELVQADGVTTSGSGLDPHITLENAMAQLPRVGASRLGSGQPPGGKYEEIMALIREKSFSPLWGLAGGPMVNVFELNLALEAKFPRKPTFSGQ